MAATGEEEFTQLIAEKEHKSTQHKINKIKTLPKCIVGTSPAAWARRVTHEGGGRFKVGVGNQL